MNLSKAYESFRQWWIEGSEEMSEATRDIDPVSLGALGLIVVLFVALLVILGLLFLQ